MTPATDDDALEAAFEALLAGRSAPPAGGGLVAFTDGVRATAARPPRPSAALAALLETGLLTDQSSAPAPGAAARSRRRRSPMFLSSLLGKIASLGLLAKAGTVAGVVVVGVSTAGFTQSLPAPLQTTWDHVVTHDDPSGTTAGTTPAADPSGTATSTPAATESGDDTGDHATTAAGSSTPAPTTPGTVPAQQTQGNGIGAQVSELAHEGKTAGGAASALAHQRNEDRRAAASSSAGSSPVAGDSGDQQGTSGSGSDSASGSGSDVASQGSVVQRDDHGSGHGSH